MNNIYSYCNWCLAIIIIIVITFRRNYPSLLRTTFTTTAFLQRFIHGEFYFIIHSRPLCTRVRSKSWLLFSVIRWFRKSGRNIPSRRWFTPPLRTTRGIRPPSNNFQEISAIRSVVHPNPSTKRLVIIRCLTRKLVKSTRISLFTI